MINKMVVLSLGDWKNIQRDPLLIFTMIGTLLLAALVRFGLPQLTVLLQTHTTFNLEEHYRLIVSLVLLMTPLMIGMLYGFMILDERDEEVLLYYSVTPLTKTGYLFCRLLVPMVLTFTLSFVVVFIQGVVEWNFLSFIPIALLLAIQAPLITMMMASLASNKVEGLALTKVINLCVLAPLIDYAVSHPIAKVVAIFPVYWPALAFQSGEDTNWSGMVLVGLVVALLWFVLLNKMFQRKIG
ncbi:hypothetical protein [Salirhabdus euzebyi]|nr:hypothetical protein [Salirhabdus euzebyi]